MIARTALLMLLAAAVHAEPAPSPGWEQLPLKKEPYARPPTEWPVTKSAAQQVEFATPCVTKENLIQEKVMVVATYACNVGEMLYVVIVSPLDALNDAQRDHWAEKFSVDQVEIMQKRASEHGMAMTVKPEYRVAYEGARGVHLKVAIGDRKVVMRVLSNAHTGVCLQVLSRGPDPDSTAAQLFSSLKLK